MDNLKLNLTSATARDFLTTMLPIAEDIRTQDEMTTFDQFLACRFDRYLYERPREREDLKSVVACLDGIAEESFDAWQEYDNVRARE